MRGMNLKLNFSPKILARFSIRKEDCEEKGLYLFQRVYCAEQ